MVPLIRLGCQVILTDMGVIVADALPVDPLDALRELARSEAELEQLRRAQVEAARAGVRRGSRWGTRWGSLASRLGSTSPRPSGTRSRPTWRPTPSCLRTTRWTWLRMRWGRFVVGVGHAEPR